MHAVLNPGGREICPRAHATSAGVGRRVRNPASLQLRSQAAQSSQELRAKCQNFQNKRCGNKTMIRRMRSRGESNGTWQCQGEWLTWGECWRQTSSVSLCIHTNKHQREKVLDCFFKPWVLTIRLHTVCINSDGYKKTSLCFCQLLHVLCPHDTLSLVSLLHQLQSVFMTKTSWFFGGWFVCITTTSIPHTKK